MKMRWKGWLTPAVVALMLGAALAGCGSGGSSKSAQSSNHFFPIVSP